MKKIIDLRSWWLVVLSVIIPCTVKADLISSPLKLMEDFFIPVGWILVASGVLMILAAMLGFYCEDKSFIPRFDHKRFGVGPKIEYAIIGCMCIGALAVMAKKFMMDDIAFWMYIILVGFVAIPIMLGEIIDPIKYQLADAHKTYCSASKWLATEILMIIARYLLLGIIFIYLPVFKGGMTAVAIITAVVFLIGEYKFHELHSLGNWIKASRWLWGMVIFYGLSMAVLVFAGDGAVKDGLQAERESRRQSFVLYWERQQKKIPSSDKSPE